ncbi:hypothetical protein K461DRAFT_288271 [Myriangium duriaei CBS 260.36]|uniref:Alpha N-terminal protein methyltransferase 1 n=1 Tax=Myriangium duriaei CBS 260.36 TaxID=1168546 RepID=A0A9P4IUR8_9PEZI|nr:hypothetical protein K461DRAFT_288271 [Myriangium duriaei CBS 260.36]
MTISPASTSPPPDSHIDHAAAIKYWSSTPATVSGVLGGYPGLSRTDIQGSANFLAKLRRAAPGGAKGKLTRAVDCGAGIGRITLGLLGKVAETVDVVEPVESFCDVVRKGEEFESFRGTVWEVGLEGWEPEEERYDLIWNQWCLSQLTDKQLVGYLERSKAWLKEGGWVVVKENLSNDVRGMDVFDETDSSVTRTKEKFEAVFEQAGLKVLRSELQRGFPKELYPVRMWGLQPV